MILKAFKEKSNQNYINKLLANRSSKVNANKVKSVAVLLNQVEFDDAESFRLYFKELGLLSPKNNVSFFCESEEDKKAQWETYFTKKDFGWSGRIKSIDLEQFISESFDVLIGYYNEDIPELNQIVAMSNANFKVGIHKHDERLFDLLIDISVNNFSVFKKEFKKYLTILNKI